MSSSPTPAPASSQPLTVGRFLVTLGTTKVSVSQVAGIEVDLAIVVTREGSSDAAGPQKEPGQLNYANLILTRPLTTDLTLWNWMQQTLQGAPSQQSMQVVLEDGQGNPVLRWDFKNAFPVRWTGPVLNAVSNDLAIETLEIAHAGFTMTTGA